MPNTENSNPKEKKKKKPKIPGPIRFKGLLPLAILVSLAVIYSLFFFDAHLKWLLETVGGKINGARVDISYLKTSFWRCNFELKKLEVANPNEEFKNRFEIGNIQFQFLFGPLLSKKFVIREMAVNDISYGTERTRSGKLPPGSGGFEIDLAPLVEKYFPGVLDEMRSNIKENPLANMGNLFSDFDINNELKKVEAGLNSKKLIENIQNDVQNADSRFKAQVNSLPGPKEARAYQGRIEQIPKRKFKSPGDVQAAIKEVQSIKKGIETDVNRVKQVHDAVQSQVSTFTSRVASIDDTVKQDIESVKSKLKLPSLDLKDLSSQLFGPKLRQAIERITYWVAFVRSKMPKGKKQGDTTVVEEERAKGVDVRFGKKGTYPKFLLMKAVISSEVSEQSQKGKVEGTVIGLTSDPPIYGRPTTATLQGDFPASRIFGVKMDLEIDHVTEQAKESMRASVSAFPLEEFPISESDDVKFGIKKARGTAQMNATFSEDTLKAETKFIASRVNYEASAKDQIINTTLNNVLRSLNTFNLTARVSGPFNDLDLFIASDLGKRIADGFKKEFQSRINELNNKIKKRVNDEISGKKKELQSKIDGFKSQTLKPVQDKLKIIQDVQNKANQAIAQVKAEAKKQTEKKAKKALEKPLKDLKKKFKIPGF